MEANSFKAIEALADPTRRAILERLLGGPLAVKDIASGLPVSRPAVSQHLGVLKRAGLVNERRQGTSRLYRLEPGGLDALLSIAQMPPGVPVACVGVDSAKNAAVLAARILEA